MEDIVAEQAAILSEIAKSKNDPPWMTAGPLRGGRCQRKQQGHSREYRPPNGRYRAYVPEEIGSTSGRPQGSREGRAKEDL